MTGRLWGGLVSPPHPNYGAGVLELIAAEGAAFRDFYKVTPGEVHLIDGATCLMVRTLKDPLANLVMETGVRESATEATLDSVAALYDGLPHRVQVDAAASPPELAQLLEARGYAKAEEFTRFHRDVEQADPRATSLEIRAVVRDDGFSFVLLTVLNLPGALRPMLAALPGRSGWHCFVAYEADEPVAAAALFVDGDIGWLGWAATQHGARGRGAQSAMIAARIEAARRAGCRALTVETDDEPSRRNLVRAGFRDVGLRADYVTRPAW
jgi:GNAT superfamily N-acetyltransferase